jgi:hypothetical protein
MKTRTAARTLKKPDSREPFLAIRTEREYDAAVEHLNALVDDVGDHPPSECAASLCHTPTPARRR